MLQNKKVNLIIAFVLALGLWLYINGTISQETTKKFKDLNISLINQNSLIEEGFAVDSVEPSTIDITVSGPRSLISSLKESEIKVTADVYSRYKGKNYVTIDVEVPKGIKVESKSSSKILVNIDTLVTEERQVEGVLSGELPENTVLAGNDIEPKSVKIHGTQSNISKVLNVNAIIESSKLKGTKSSQKAKLVAADKSGNAVSFVSLSSDEAYVTSNLEKFKTVDLVVNTDGEVDSQYEVEDITKPKKIDIQGSEDVLKSITKIESETIDISGVTTSSKIKITPILPDGVKLKSGSEEPYINVVLKNLKSKTFKVGTDDIDIRGVASGLKAAIASQSISVTVISKDGKTINIGESDLKLYVNVSGQSEGDRRVAVSSDIGSNYTVTINPEKVTVRLSEE